MIFSIILVKSREENTLDYSQKMLMILRKIRKLIFLAMLTLTFQIGLGKKME